MFPVDSGLFPVPPGTEKTNHINGLRQPFGFVPGVPGQSGRHPEGNAAKGTPPPCLVRVLSAAMAGEFPACPWGVVLCTAPPVLGPSWLELVRVIRCAMADCARHPPRGLSEGPALLLQRPAPMENRPGRSAPRLLVAPERASLARMFYPAHVSGFSLPHCVLKGWPGVGGWSKVWTPPPETDRLGKFLCAQVFGEGGTPCRCWPGLRPWRGVLKVGADSTLDRPPTFTRSAAK